MHLRLHLTPVHALISAQQHDVVPRSDHDCRLLVDAVAAADDSVVAFKADFVDQVQRQFQPVHVRRIAVEGEVRGPDHQEILFVADLHHRDAALHGQVGDGNFLGDVEEA